MTGARAPSEGRDLPERVVTEAERLTRRAREAVEEAERAGAVRARDRLLADHGFTARVRREESREVLVLHPAEWVEDEFDYENELGISISKILGFLNPQFKGNLAHYDTKENFGVVTIDTALSVYA